MFTNNLSSKVDALTAPIVGELVALPTRQTFEDFDRAAQVLVADLSDETLNDLYQGYLQDHRSMFGRAVDLERWKNDLPRYVSTSIRLDYVKRTR